MKKYLILLTLFGCYPSPTTNGITYGSCVAWQDDFYGNCSGSVIVRDVTTIKAMARCTTKTPDVNESFKYFSGNFYLKSKDVKLVSCKEMEN